MQHTLALDLKTGTLSLVSSREALTSLTLRRGGRYGLRLFMTEFGSPVDLPAGYTLESSAKQSADSPNALIFSPWSGASPVECTLHAAGSVLDGLLSVDGDANNDVESVDLLFDVLVLDGSGEVVAQSQRVTLTVENTVTRGGETGPEHAPLSARLIESLPGVTGLVGGEPEHLDARATVGLPLGWRVLVKDGGLLRVYELKDDDGGGIPEGAVLPVDHDAEDNGKVWVPASFEGVTAEQLADALAGKADATALSDHTGNTSNPHNVTAVQVGLGSVPNFGVASQAQAEAGTATDKLMTPERTAQAIAALGGGGGAPGGVSLETVQSMLPCVLVKGGPIGEEPGQVKVAKAGDSLDIASFTIPGWISRYHLGGTGTLLSRIVAENGGTAGVSMQLRSATGGGGAALSATVSFPATAGLSTGFAGTATLTLARADYPVIYARQAAEFSADRNVSLYLMVFPLP